MAEHRYTFLFTDIEGSTRLWGRAPDAMAAAVQRQETLLRLIVAEHGGSVFKTVGDGLYAVFEDGPSAVRATVAAQRTLLAELWNGFEDSNTIAVRIGVHSGGAEVRDGDFFGPTLNRLSRMLAAGHGGQVLCTDATVDVCGEDWPGEIDLRDLGERTLRDVPGSGRIFQLVADGLPEHFPPLTTLDPRVHNLPRWPSAMVGRGEEQARMRAALRSSGTRMVTVLGTGGVGKTRLTTEVAAQLLDEYQDGIRFVDLSALREDAQVVPAIVQVTGAADQLLAPQDALLEWLRGRELLLVLDNCEQVVEGVAAICSEILHGAPGVTVLATSRVPIHIRGERQLALEPLPMSGDPVSNPAVLLFAERAQQVSGSFTLDSGNAGNVAEICHIVDGLPLAIELAAAWVRILSPEALHRRLQDGRSMLRDGARDLPDRQRTLASTIAWSYELLEPEDQRAFRRLAVFRGGIAVDAAAAVIWESAVDDPLWALTRLDALVQANLLQVAPDSTGEPRFLMLQTIQEFAVGVLRESGEWDDAASAHAEFFAGMAADAESHYGSEHVTQWFDRLDLDFENLRAAIEFLAATPEAQPLGLQLVLALFGFMDQRGHALQERAWLELLFKNQDSFTLEQHVLALVYLGNTWHSNPRKAEQFYQQAIALADRAENRQLRIRPVAALVSVALTRGNYELARSMAYEVLAYGEATASPMHLAMGHSEIAHVASEGGWFDEGLAACQAVRTYSNQTGDADGEAWGWLIEGRIYRRLRDSAAAAAALEHAMTRFAEIGDDNALALCRLEAGLACLESDPALARAQLGAAASTFVEGSDAYAVIGVFEAVSQLLIAEGDYLLGAELYGASGQLREQTGIVSSAADTVRMQRALESAIDATGADHVQLAVSRGRSLPLRGAIELCRIAIP